MKKEKRELIKEEVSAIQDKLKNLISLLEEEDISLSSDKTNEQEYEEVDEEVIHDEDIPVVIINTKDEQGHFSM